MKRKITLLFAAALGAFTVNAQVVLNESFTATWSPSGAGWTATNVSIPATATLTSGWFQGNSAVFTANSGGPSDYYASNYQIGGNGGAAAADLNAFLITPTVNITNGATLQFATRTTNAGTATPFPDRMQVRWSAGTGTAVGTTTASPGTFTNVILDINPLYSTNTSSAVSSGSVNGYPNQWTVYTLTISGVTGTVQGRFAFRYFVQNGGGGANSDYIGLDDVQYSLPCAAPSVTVSPSTTGICSGNSVTLTASGATTYTWNTGATTAAIVVSPTANVVYNVSGSTAGCIGTQTAAVTVTLTPNVAVSNVTTCVGTSVTLTAGGATTYSWNTGATTATISNSGTNATYTVTGSNGICANTKTVSVTTGSNLSVGVSSTSSVVCAGISATLTASGAATSYSWLPTGSGASIVVTPTAGATYTVTGSNGACFGANTIAIAVNALPTVSITLSSPTNTVCTTQGTITTTASGASTYTWAPFASNATVVTVNTPTAVGSYSFGVTGTSSLGCTKNYTTTLVVTLCTGIANNAIETNNAVVYPNPFTNELTVSGVSGTIEVVNTLGQVVLTTTISESQTINTSGFAKGIYFIKVKNADTKGTQTIKVIKD